MYFLSYVFKFYQNLKVFEKEKALYIDCCLEVTEYSFLAFMPFLQQRRWVCLPDT